MLKELKDRNELAAELQKIAGNDRAGILKSISTLTNKDLADDLTQIVADLPTKP